MFRLFALLCLLIAALPAATTAAGEEQDGDRTAAHRARAVRRRRARARPRRRAAGARGAAHPGRCDRRHEHGRRRRRPLCLGHDGGRDRRADARHRLERRVSRPSRAQHPQLPPQAGRPRIPGALPARDPGRQLPRAARPDPGPATDADAPAADDAGRRGRELRRAADAVSRGRGGPRDRRAHRARERRPDLGDARQHVGTGRVRAGRGRRPPAGGRRHRREPAGRRRQEHGRRHRDRGGRRLPAGRPQGADLGARGLEPGGHDHDAAGDAAAARAPVAG